MRLITVRNDAAEPTLALDHFERRHYAVEWAHSIALSKYKGFYGEILEAHQCNEAMDIEVASKIISEMVRKYETPDTEVILMSDNGNITNENLVEIQAVKVIEYEEQNGVTVPARTKTVVIHRKHVRDGYIDAVLKLAYETEFGEGSYHGS